MSDVIICFSHFDEQKIMMHDCPTCKSEQQFLAEHEPWYGWSLTCLNCGDQWNDGELSERPFARGWRQRAIDHAKQRIEKLGLVLTQEEEV